MESTPIHREPPMLRSVQQPIIHLIRLEDAPKYTAMLRASVKCEKFEMKRKRKKCQLKLEIILSHHVSRSIRKLRREKSLNKVSCEDKLVICQRILVKKISNNCLIIRTESLFSAVFVNCSEIFQHINMY